MKPPPPGYDPSLIKKKNRERLLGELLPYKRDSSSSQQPAADLAELEAPIPMDATPSSSQKQAARHFMKASRKKNQVSPSVSTSDFADTDCNDATNSGNQLVSPSKTRKFYLGTVEVSLDLLHFMVLGL